MDSENNKIDYTEKIRTFQAMVDNYNEEIALNYLTKANWNETKAAQLFFNDTLNTPMGNNTSSNRQSSKVNNMMGSPHYLDDINGERSDRRNPNNYQELSQNENEMNVGLIGNNRPRQEQPGMFTRYIIKPLAYLGSFFCNRSGDRMTEEESRIFAELPEKVSNLNSFSTLIKTRIGIIVLYQQSDMDYYTNFINDIKKESYIMDILKVNYVIYPVLATSSEGKRIQSLIVDPMLYPALVFSFNKRGNNTFNRGSILDRLEGHITTDVFRDALIRNVETRDRVESSRSLRESNVDLIQQQKEEIEHLERLENQRKNKEKEDKLKAEREKEEKRQKEEDLRNSIKEKLEALPNEPAADDPNSAYIIFRYPDGNRRAERRFLKSHKIKVLYDYVDSLGPCVFDESDKYELIQPFPFKLYNNPEKTLVEEQLFPNAVLQIREI